MTDSRITEFLAHKHADALAKVQVWTDISNNVRSDQTRKIAEARSVRRSREQLCMGT
jgi:hypothetical protein